VISGPFGSVDHEPHQLTPTPPRYPLPYLTTAPAIRRTYHGRMEARHLRYALALAEHQHFGRAAASLGIAQPPLSTQIAALEREVGERLFDRTSHGVFPTAAGNAFLARASSALAEMHLAGVDAGRAARGETGRLRL